MSEPKICSICGATLSEDEAYYHDGQILCEDCFEGHTALCDHCSRRIWRDDAEGDDNTILCVRCYENHYTACEECSRLIHNEDAIYDDDSCYYYCDECYRKLHQKAIKSYNYKPEPMFHGSGLLFMGVELEIDRGGESHANARELLVLANGTREHIYCKHDGSLQAVVGGYIQAIYPFEDEELALICQEEGKLIGLPLNRALMDEDGAIYDIISGTFFLCRAPADSERFASLTEEQVRFGKERFERLDLFAV